MTASRTRSFVVPMVLAGLILAGPWGDARAQGRGQNVEREGTSPAAEPWAIPATEGEGVIEPEGVLAPEPETTPAPVLTPPAAPRREGPMRLEPRRPDGASQAPTPAPGVVSKSGVEIDTLSNVQMDAAGPLTQGQGGLGTGMWQGTDRALVEALLPRLPTRYPSRALRDLARRLLLSSAVVPQGEGESGSLLKARVRALLAMGDTEGAGALLAAVPGRSLTGDLARLDVEARLTAGDTGRACARIAEQIVQDASSIFLQKGVAFCQALDGAHDKAALSVSLLREQDGADPIFYSLMDAMAGLEGVKLGSLPDPTPLHLAMIGAAKLPLPEEALKQGTAAVLRAMAINPAMPPERRLDAAERAMAAGILTADALRGLYGETAFKKDDLANPLSRADGLSGPMARALLYRASATEIVPAARVEAVAMALKRSHGDGRFAMASQAFLSIIEAIEPRPEYDWLATDAARALMANNRADAAGPWIAMLQRGAGADGDAAEALISLQPVAFLAKVPDARGWTAERLDEWWRVIAAKDKARDQAALVYTAFDAMGYPVAPSLWTALMIGADYQSVAMPHAAVWNRMVEAARSRLLGETILLSLVAMGGWTEGAPDTVILGRVLRSLRAVGLQDEARALAIEAILATGS